MLSSLAPRVWRPDIADPNVEGISAMAALPDRRPRGNHAYALTAGAQRFAFIEAVVSGFARYSFADPSPLLAAAPSGTPLPFGPTTRATVVLLASLTSFTHRSWLT